MSNGQEEQTNGNEDFKPLMEVIGPPMESRAATLCPELAERNLGAALEQAENRVEFAKQIKVKSLKITSPSDWIDMNGKPYLQATGAEKLCWLWGIYWKDLHIEPSLSEAARLFSDNQAVSFEVIGVVGSKTLGLELVIYGGRSSSDDFFTARYEGHGQGRRKVARPMSQVDVLDVRKAAVTNWIAQAVTRVLGLRGMSWDELKAHGIRPSGRVEFKQPPPKPKTETKAPPTDGEEVSANQLSVDEMCQAIRDRLGREEKDPDIAIKTMTKGYIPTLEALGNAPDSHIRRLFDRIFPPTAAA